jgi:hypothetical protein
MNTKYILQRDAHEIDLHSTSLLSNGKCLDNSGFVVGLISSLG